MYQAIPYLDIDTLIRLHSNNQLIPHSATIENIPGNILVLDPHLANHYHYDVRYPLQLSHLCLPLIQSLPTLEHERHPIPPLIVNLEHSSSKCWTR